MRSLALLALALGGARAFMTVPKERAEEPASAVAAGAEDFGAPEKAPPKAPSKDSKDWTLPVAPPKDSKDWKALPPAPPKDGKAMPPSPTAKRPEVPPPPAPPRLPSLVGGSWVSSPPPAPKWGHSLVLSPPPPPQWGHDLSWSFDDVALQHERFYSGANCAAYGCSPATTASCRALADAKGAVFFHMNPPEGSADYPPGCVYSPGIGRDIPRYFWNQLCSANYGANYWDACDPIECNVNSNCVCRCVDYTQPGILTTNRELRAAAIQGDTSLIAFWDVSLVDDFSHVFTASSFNADISAWDVSQGTAFRNMFSGASSFNADISGWDVAKGKDFHNMLGSAHSFDQDLSEWNLSQATRLDGMFHNTDMNDATHCPAPQPGFPADCSAW